MPKRLTTEQFIQKAKQIHGDRYSYDRVQYINNKTPVQIICSTHGIFEQQPNAHIDSKSGCPQCGRSQCDASRSLSHDDFIARATAAHGNKYDYSMVSYVHNSDVIEIVCPTHGAFYQRAYEHIKRGRETGCPACSNSGISRKAINWIKGIANNEHINIQHALNGGEYRIPGTRYKADGFCADTNTIYEFYGDKWHGNLEVYDRTDCCHPFMSATAGELYDNTMNREQELTSLGYHVVSIWESEYDRLGLQK